MTEPIATTDRGELLAFIVAQQASPASATAYLGDEAAGIEAELEGLDQPWLDTARVIRRDGTLTAAALAEWDTEVGRAWVHGPWAAEGTFVEVGEALVRAVAAQCPAGITEFEFSGDIANTGMADLGEHLGWRATKVNHAYAVAADAITHWPSTEGVRLATQDDLPALAALHGSEFPNTYATTAQLLTRHTTLVVDRGGAVVGYASGQLQDDGHAYIDFMAVDAGYRGLGLARGLLGGLARLLAASGNPGKVHLTVEDDRAPAITLYESLGMRRVLSLRGYRGPLG
ncbi:GNAT family N-acetyltransferase [Propioniciclava sp. MC1683]|uniref:GNAT family N-acetyltransferase n=1 Tax=Propioniciclava sp. MC1683 TaxID=2760309 RepID=UPI00160076DD|nr:GNAT family N-acetyltransferase [Propioniciclava sp. MC1683]MBB1502100.1 GNAT family N-acetyltransferase [Propioniciclava sp. MC1683]